MFFSKSSFVSLNKSSSRREILFFLYLYHSFLSLMLFSFISNNFFIFLFFVKLCFIALGNFSLFPELSAWLTGMRYTKSLLKGVIGDAPSEMSFTFSGDSYLGIFFSGVWWSTSNVSGWSLSQISVTISNDLYYDNLLSDVFSFDIWTNLFGVFKTSSSIVLFFV